MQSTINTNVNNNGIHCKVATQDTVRRFYAKSTEYNALLEQICNIFGFSKDSVVVKYLDDEGDLVTISSDPELKFAVELSPRILKLKLELVRPQAQPPTPAACAGEQRRMCNKKWRKSVERCEKKKKCERAEKCKNKGERRRAKLESLKSKEEKLKAKLTALEASPASTSYAPDSDPAAEKMRVDRKLARIASKIAWLERANSSVQEPAVPSASAPAQEPEVVEVSSPETSESSESDSSSSAKEELRQRICSARFGIRQAHLQVQVKRANLKQFVSQKPAESDDKFKETVQQLKGELEGAKKELRAKKEEMRSLMGSFKSAYGKKCGKWKGETESIPTEEESAESYPHPEFHHFGARGRHWSRRGGSFGPHGHGPHGFHHHHHGPSGFPAFPADGPWGAYPGYPRGPSSC